MQNLAAQTYQQTAQATVSPRSLEADLLTKAAASLQRIADDWEGRSGELNEALTYNRKLWQIFVAAVTDKTNPLPDPIKQNIANLGVFVFSQTYELSQAPAASKLKSLISINRDIAAGLRAQA